MTRFQPLGAVLLLGVLATLGAGPTQAQWVQTSGPRGASINSLLAVPNGAGGTRLYAGQLGIWKTENGGASWSHFTNGLTDPNMFSLIAVPNGSGGNDLFVGTNSGVFRSTDDGASWNPSNNGLTNISVYALASGSNGSGGINLYAGCFLGNVFRSTNNGASWAPIQTGLPLGFSIGEVITTSAGTVLAGTMDGIYRSTNFGGNWTRVATQFGFSFAKDGSTLYAGTSSGVFRSTNDGATWTAINNGIQFTWTYAVAAIPGASGVTLFAGAGGVLRSTNNGATWTSANNGLTGFLVQALVTAPNGSGGTDLYAGSSEGVFRTSDNGDHWTNVTFVASQVATVETTPSGTILAGTDMDAFRSVNGGSTWTDTNAQSSPLDFAVNLQGTSGVSVFAVDALTGIHKSTDDGATWFDSNNDISDIEVNSITVVPNGTGGTNLLVGDYSGIFLSTNDGGSWQSVYPPAMPLAWVTTPNGTGGHDIFGGGFGTVKSTDHGHTWSILGLTELVQGMAATADGANLFASGEFGVSRSTDHGATWTLVNNGLTDIRVISLLSPDGTHLFAGGAGGVFLSNDNGNSWSTVGTGLTIGVRSLALSTDGSTLIAGTSGLGVWKRPLSEMIGTTGVDAGETAPPNAIVLGNNLPNPFRDGTTIQYALPRTMAARLVVYDVAGHAVRTLVNGTQAAGERRVTWDGRNDSGSPVSRGVYLCRLEAGGMTQTRKMILH